MKDNPYWRGYFFVVKEFFTQKKSVSRFLGLKK